MTALNRHLAERVRREKLALGVLLETLADRRGMFVMAVALFVQWLWAWLIVNSSAGEELLESLLTGHGLPEVDWRCFVLVPVLGAPTLIAEILFDRRYPVHMTFALIAGPGVAFLTLVHAVVS